MRTETLKAIKTAMLALKIANKYVAEEIADMTAQDSLTAEELVTEFDDLRKFNAWTKETREDLTILEKRLSYHDIPDLFKKRKLKNINVIGVGRVQINRRWSCSIVEGMKDQAYQYLRDEGDGALIIETVNAQTLGAHAHKLATESGIELPTEYFKTSVAPYTSIEADAESKANRKG